jgi:predicted nicotinamide N-methyase
MSDNFIRAHTKLLPAPLVPEIRLHLAEESLPIWRSTEEELGQMNVPPPYWAFAWAGGQALARYILDNPGLVRGRRVLDLGSGSGLTAIAAKQAGAIEVVATDIDAFARAAIRLNAAANAVQVHESSEDFERIEPDGYDLVLAGDLFYERPLAERVLTFIEDAGRKGVRTLVGDPGRSYFPKDKFRLIGEYSVPVTRDLEDAEIKRTAVWELAPG